VSGPIIAIENCAVTYLAGPAWSRRSVAAVRGVSLTIDAGETVGLVGESGSGKTTVGRLCLGLVRPSRGDVRFAGAPLGRKGGRIPGQLSVVLQHPDWALNPRLRAGVSVAEPLAILGAGTRQARAGRVAEMLELVGLDARFADRYPHELSGGQRQRIAIARALITDPRLVVFDEAVSALDVSVQAQVLNLIKELQASKGFAALFIAHDMAATRYISHRIAVMYAGVLMEIAPVHRFYSRPQHPYSRALRVTIAEWDRKAFEFRGTPGDAETQGCVLSGRCPWAIQRCREQRPELRTVNDGLSACHRAEEVAAA
jgi:oligopeptide/dipeptide ABC transporter ATP-binding protein